MFYGLHLRGELCHIPEHRFQPAYPVTVQRDHIHAVIRSRSPDRKHSDHLSPVRRCTVDDDLVVITGLQFVKLCSIFHIDLSDGCRECHGSFFSRLRSK